MAEHECPLFVADCHVRAAIALVDHAWDPVVISALRSGPIRRADLLRGIGEASDKVLTESLRRLVVRGLVAKTSPNTPGDGRGGRSAVYELTALGVSFASGPLAHMAQWAARNQVALSSS